MDRRGSAQSLDGMSRALNCGASTIVAAELLAASTKCTPLGCPLFLDQPVLRVAARDAGIVNGALSATISDVPQSNGCPGCPVAMLTPSTVTLQLAADGGT
jgi:hypothetical protein